jgi:hypothetical protein
MITIRDIPIRQVIAATGILFSTHNAGAIAITDQWLLACKSEAERDIVVGPRTLSKSA